MRFLALTSRDDVIEGLKLGSEVIRFTSFSELFDFSQTNLQKKDVSIIDICFSGTNIFEHQKDFLIFFSKIPSMVICPLEEIEIARKCYHLGVSFVGSGRESISFIRGFLENAVTEKTDHKVFGLTRVERNIFNLMIKRRIVHSETVENVVWAGQKRCQKNIDVHMRNLKGKIKGLGYKIEKLNDYYTLNLND